MNEPMLMMMSGASGRCSTAAEEDAIFRKMDTIFRNATIVDGNGGAPYVGAQPPSASALLVASLRFSSQAL